MRTEFGIANSLAIWKVMFHFANMGHCCRSVRIPGRHYTKNAG